MSKRNVLSTSARSLPEYRRISDLPSASKESIRFATSAIVLAAGLLVLEERRVSAKLIYILVCGAASLAFSWWHSPIIRTQGLYGLSGIAHGLMVISGLEMARNRQTRYMGSAYVLIVTAKALYEFSKGEVFFEFLLFGMCGSPIAACHAGGVVGGILVFLCYARIGNSFFN